MTVQNYVTPTGKLVVVGEPRRIREKNLGTVANGYPGRLLNTSAVMVDPGLASMGMAWSAARTWRSFTDRRSMPPLKKSRSFLIRRD